MRRLRIGISTYGADGGRSGISRYLVRLLEEWHRAGFPHDLELIGQPSDKDLFRPAERGWGWLPGGPLHRVPALDLLWHQAVLPILCARRGWDALFLPAANRRVTAMCPCPVVGTVHDLASVHLPEKYDPLRTFYIRRLLPAAVRRLDRVITVSGSSRDDLVEFARLPQDRVEVVPLGADLAASSAPIALRELAAVRARYDLARPFLLYVSRIEHPGKNHVRLLEAFDRFKTRTGAPHQLVLAGSDWQGAEVVHEAVRRSRFAADIRCLGFVPDEDLRALYAAATGFVFPSRFEGFGLPILEAMAAGTPTACSNVSSMPEVAGEAALLFDPDDAEDLERAIEKLALDATVRRQLFVSGLERAASFRWSTTASRTLEILETASLDASREIGLDKLAASPDDAASAGGVEGR